MANYTNRIMAAILMCTTFLSGCDNVGKNSNIKNDVKFDSITAERIYHLLGDENSPNCNLQIKFTFPTNVGGNKELTSKIQALFITNYFGENYSHLSPEQAVELYIENYLSSYKELEEDFKAEIARDRNMPMESWFSYSEASVNEVNYNKNGILCYTVSFEGYTGGAHGAHSQTLYTIDLENGKEITEEDIFVNDYQERLANILVKKIAELYRLDDIKELENIGFFNIDEIYPNENFIVDNSGITYIFNEYEIAAYVVGNIEVHIPFSEIEYLIKRDGAIAHIVF
jgi:Protein of unknown function (DUF3298).